ncbi:unnamed protein product [Moneuplotes crassus]|uniref:Cyclic nucleotide-binding domain-containing protein n=1 Tax=Euplotes crassus TaxID=5936 RepID=A0AAD1XG40_EUPCR|nr:unnamed protein product [Moneuplotes crassus]
MGTIEMTGSLSNIFESIKNKAKKIIEDQSSDPKECPSSSSRTLRGKKHPAIEMLTRRKKEATQYYTMRLIIDNIYFNKCYAPTNDYIKHILQKEEESRNLFDLRAISLKLDKNKFFQKLRLNGDHDAVINCYKKLTYSRVDQRDKEVVKFGTHGSYFYIILKGIVSVYVPNSCNVQLNIIEYYKLLSEYSDMILSIDGEETWNLPVISNHLKENAESMSLGRIVAKLDRNEKLLVENPDLSQTPLNKSLKNKSKAYNFQNLAIMNNMNSKIKSTVEGKTLKIENYNIKYLKKACELKEGDSFGDLSLIYNKPRLATIKTVTPVEFALLSKEQYDSTLKALEQQKIDKKIEELDCIAFFKEYSRAFKSRLLYAVDICDFHKGQVVFKEGMKDNKIYFIIKGEFEVSKNITVHSDPRLPLFEYKLLEPDTEAKKKHYQFFTENVNLVAGVNSREIDEVRRFMDKRTNRNLVVRRVSDRDTLGLEEVLMKSPERFLNAKCISKKARIISIEGEALFTKIKRPDIIEMLEDINMKKLQMLSKSLETFINHLKERKETQRHDQIMDRLEYLEPMMTDIYLQNDKKLEAHHIQTLTKKSIALKRSKLSTPLALTSPQNPFQNSFLKSTRSSAGQVSKIKNSKSKKPKAAGSATSRSCMPNWHKRANSTANFSTMNQPTITKKPQKSNSRSKLSKRSTNRKKIVVKPIEKWDYTEVFKNWDKQGIDPIEPTSELEIHSARIVNIDNEVSMFNDNSHFKKKVDKMQPYLGGHKEDEYKRLCRIYKDELEKEDHLQKCSLIRNKYPTLLEKKKHRTVSNIKFGKKSKIRKKKNPKGCYRPTSALTSIPKQHQEFMTEGQKLEISQLSLKSSGLKPTSSSRGTLTQKRNSCFATTNHSKKESPDSSIKKLNEKYTLHSIFQSDIERIVDNNNIERISIAKRSLIRPRSSLSQRTMVRQRKTYEVSKNHLNPVVKPKLVKKTEFLSIDYKKNKIHQMSSNNFL